MVLMVGLFLRQFRVRWLILVSVLVRLAGIVVVGSVRMRMSMLMLMRMSQVAVAMLMRMLMRVFVDVGHRFLVFHCSLLSVMPLNSIAGTLATLTPSVGWP